MRHIKHFTTNPNIYEPVPRIDTPLVALGIAKIILSMDLCERYWQIALHENLAKMKSVY